MMRRKEIFGVFIAIKLSITLCSLGFWESYFSGETYDRLKKIMTH